MIVVTAPTAIAAIYFGLWAAPRYVSETQLVVRTVEGNQLAGGSVVNAMLNAFLNMPSSDDANSVVAYLQSRDAVRDLEAALPLRKMYAREEADAPARFPRPFSGDSFEQLYWYYNNRVTVYTDPDTEFITI